MSSLHLPLALFLALFGLYSPLAAVSSYFPVVSRLRPGDQKKLAVGLFTYVAIFGMVALWIGEPLLELLGLSTAALTVTGGIALMYAAIPIMRGTEAPAEPPPVEAGKEVQTGSWKSVLFMPVTFPLTVGGTTFAFFVSFRAQTDRLRDIVALSIAALAYAALTGITLYASGHLERRVSSGTRIFLERIAGILLVAIAVSLLLSGGPRMVVETINNMKAP
jgi:multiple antibiotic resistance protein